MVEKQISGFFLDNCIKFYFIVTFISSNVAFFPSDEWCTGLTASWSANEYEELDFPSFWIGVKWIIL